MHVTDFIHECIVNCLGLGKGIRHGLDKQYLGNIAHCNSYGRNILFATSKFFERFCNETPKDKYCHEFTTGDFSQSSLKKVIFLMPQE